MLVLLLTFLAQIDTVGTGVPATETAPYIKPAFFALFVLGLLIAAFRLRNGASAPHRDPLPNPVVISTPKPVVVSPSKPPEVAPKAALPKPITPRPTLTTQPSSPATALKPTAAAKPTATEKPINPAQKRPAVTTLPPPVSATPQQSVAPVAPVVPPVKRPAPRVEAVQISPMPPVPQPAPARPVPEAVPVPSEIKYTNYEPLPPGSGTGYPLLRWPTGKGVPVKFPRAGRSANRGYCEAAFVEHLRRHFPKSGPVRVLDNHHLPTPNAARPYEPDMALLHERNGLNLFLCVEIDEPYDGANRLPTHCDGDDDSRDTFFTRRGWVVLRFAEIQVHQQPEECCAVIARLIARLDATYAVPEALKSLAAPAEETAWGVVQAQKWAKARYREKYLGIANFGRYEGSEKAPTSEQRPEDVAIEKLVAQTVVLPPPPKPEQLITANPDPRSKALSFEADAHQYYINGQPALSVSTLVGRFFPEFDTAYWSARNAAKEGCTAAELAKRWKDKGETSARAGTALHQEIEKFYNDATPGNSAEFACFLDFHRDYAHLVPHRTEWQVYDERLMLAGTLDFVARNADGSLSIYDWKRTHRVMDKRTNLIVNSAYDGPITGPLNDLPDCAFSHYTLQQNLYKHLLETSYGYRVRDMHLVVMHPDYGGRYHLVPVPERLKHVEQMLSVARSRR